MPKVGEIPKKAQKKGGGGGGRNAKPNRRNTGENTTNEANTENKDINGRNCYGKR